MVRKMTAFPVITKPQAPHWICRQKKVKCPLFRNCFYLYTFRTGRGELTVSFRARIMGSPNADTTMPVVMKYASSLQALLDSVLSLRRLDMKVGIGLSTQKIRTNSGQYTLWKRSQGLSSASETVRREKQTPAACFQFCSRDSHYSGISQHSTLQCKAFSKQSLLPLLPCSCMLVGCLETN